MKLKGLNDYDICNYKKPVMFLIFPYCSFKCDKECGQPVCQNSQLVKEPIININIQQLILRYLDNPLTKAIVCGGLEPFDSWDELYDLCESLRYYCDDDIVIYTGYKEEEILDKIEALSELRNIIVKFGRFIPDSPHIFDAVLGVELASNNQYAKVLINEHPIANNGED